MNGRLLRGRGRPTGWADFEACRRAGRAPGSAEPAWRIPPEPVFRIGWGEGEPQLEEVATGVVFPDGRIAVGDRGSQLIRILSAAGEVLETFGGEGDGPGEFTRLSTIVRLGGDTLLAQQSFNPLLSIFVDAELVRTGRFENLIGGGLYGILGRTREGAFALWSTQGYMVRGSPPTGWLRFPVLRSAADFTRLDTLADVGMVLMPEPGNVNPIRASGSVTMAGGRIAHGTNDRPQVTWIDTQGGVVQISRWDQNPEEPTAEDWAAYEGRFREQFADRYERPELEQRLADRRRDFAGPMPFFDDLHGDRSGNVWLGEYDFGSLAAVRGFSVIASDGRWIGPVAFPSRVRVLDITEEVALVVEYDELDVQAVALYRIEKPGD